MSNCKNWLRSITSSFNFNRSFSKNYHPNSSNIQAVQESKKVLIILFRKGSRVGVDKGDRCPSVYRNNLVCFGDSVKHCLVPQTLGSVLGSCSALNSYFRVDCTETVGKGVFRADRGSYLTI